MLLKKNVTVEGLRSGVRIFLNFGFNFFFKNKIVKLTSMLLQDTFFQNKLRWTKLKVKLKYRFCSKNWESQITFKITFQISRKNVEQTYRTSAIYIES